MLLLVFSYIGYIKIFTFSFDSCFICSGDFVVPRLSVVKPALIGAGVVVVVVVVCLSIVLLSSPMDPSSSLIFCSSASSSPVAAIITELRQARMSRSTAFVT